MFLYIVKEKIFRNQKVTKTCYYYFTESAQASIEVSWRFDFEKEKAGYHSRVEQARVVVSAV